MMIALISGGVICGMKNVKMPATVKGAARKAVR